MKFKPISSKRSIISWAKGKALPFQELMSYYRCAMMEIETRFKILDEDFSVSWDRNPIQSIKTRLKTPESIAAKLSRNGWDLSPQSIENNLNDVAGIRVICSYQTDVYQLAEALLKQEDITLIRRKDYISNPKSNGYRSLHLIVEVPVYLHNTKKPMRVEIQIRTMAMDWWASLEHEIRYKKNIKTTTSLDMELAACAKMCDALDTRMEYIYKMAEDIAEEYETKGR